MKLILIYGAPGTGKLTVATELAQITGYTLFHNHLILNALSDIFGYEHPSRKILEKEFRLRIIEEAVQANITLIATGVIMRDNETFYRKMITTVLGNNGECILINLTATQETLFQRIGNDSRKKYKKISTVERLTEWENQYPESFKEIEYANQLTIDTTKLSSKEAATKIMEHYKVAKLTSE